MNSALLIIAAFLVLSIYLAIRSRKGKTMDLEQWAVGGRSFGTVLVFILIAGEAFTTFTFLGGSGTAYAFGAPSIYIFNCFYFVLAYFLLPPIWKYAKKHNLISQADFYASKYNSKALGVLVSFIGVVSMVPYLVVQLKGLGIIVSEASYGSISSTAAIWIGLFSVVVYVVISGIHGSAWTAAIKDIMILAVVIFMGIYFPLHYYGGYQEMFQSIDAVHPDFWKFPDEGLSISWFISVTLSLAIGAYMWPHIQVGVFSSKSSKALRWNSAIMPIYQVILVFALFIGAAAVLKVPGLKGAETDLALFKLAKASFDPWFVGVIGAAGVLAALVPSSLLLMSSSTILSKNVYKVWKPNTTDEQLARLSRFLVPVVAIIALYFTFNGGQSIMTVYIMGYNFVVQLFPALFFSLWKKNPITVQGAAAGMIVGVAIIAYVTITSTTVGTLFPSLPSVIKDIDVGLIVLLFNFVITLGVSLVTRKSTIAPEKVEDSSSSA